MPPDHEIARASSTEGLPVAPSLGPTLSAGHVTPRASRVDGRTVAISALAVLVALIAALIAQALVRLIGLITNIAFYGRISTSFASPAGNHLGAWVLLVPVVGGLIVGVMARYGSAAIRGHGIPEAMERVLEHGSRIPPRVMFLKPLSAAFSIGTGGPFGAEGPIIATGGALGSVVGQMFQTTAAERKALLAAGAAAGMSATFGSPLAALLLAVELLLFELSPRSVIPVALASAAAAAVRIAFVGAAPVFPMPAVATPGGEALGAYVLIGALLGVVSVYVTRAVYAVEDAFERLPIHWMWWPALGAIAVGAVGFFAPRTMGVGYDNIEHIVAGELVGRAMLVLCALKFVAWAVSLGSGTSGGTLAPLFTIGGGLGAALGELAARAFPHAGIDPRVAGLVGMAALFAGASRALLTSVVFAFETTRQPAGLLPLLGGCTTAYLVSSLMMRHSIMTVKIARRGVVVPDAYGPDVLDETRVADCASRAVVALDGGDRVGGVRAWFARDAEGSRHRGFPVVDARGDVLGVLTRADVEAQAAAEDASIASLVARPPRVVSEDATMRAAVDAMASEGIGRLPVVRAGTMHLVGVLTRSDLLKIYQRRNERDGRRDRYLSLQIMRPGRAAR